MLLRLSLVLFLVISAAFLIHTFFVMVEEENSDYNSTYGYQKVMTVTGHSMEPLIPSGTAVNVIIGHYSCHEVMRNDIVTISFKTADKPMIKEVVGLPGDEVSFKGNKLLINQKIVRNSEGKAYDISHNSYIILSKPLNSGRIPPNKYLVLGDNTTPDVLDSRIFGYVEREQIVGKVIYR